MKLRSSPSARCVGRDVPCRCRALRTRPPTTVSRHSWVELYDRRHQHERQCRLVECGRRWRHRDRCRRRRHGGGNPGTGGSAGSPISSEGGPSPEGGTVANMLPHGKSTAAACRPSRRLEHQVRAHEIDARRGRRHCRAACMPTPTGCTTLRIVPSCEVADQLRSEQGLVFVRRGCGGVTAREQPRRRFASLPTEHRGHRGGSVA